MNKSRLNILRSKAKYSMSDKNINKKEVVPNDVSKHVVAQKITADFILELYDKSKKLRGKNRQAMLQVAEKLSKHVGEWLVE